MARTLARQFTEVKAASPFQFALSTRAGVDCVGHAVRAATDANPMTTVLSVDGIGAYDHVYRASMMSKLLEVPSLRHLLPFVRQAYGSATSYSWQDADGQRIGGGETSLARRRMSVRVFGRPMSSAAPNAPPPSATCWPTDWRPLQAFSCARVKFVCPDGVVDLYPEVWSPSGAKILGTLVGSPEFVSNLIEERLDEERKLWQAISWVPDQQCAWKILIQCAAPRLSAHSATQRIPGLRAGAR